MTRDGLPERLFTTNRRATAEAWYEAETDFGRACRWLFPRGAVRIILEGMKPPAALSSLFARLRTRPRAMVVALVVALMLGPISAVLAAAVPSAGDHMPCEISAGHPMMDGGAGAPGHDTSGGCASMQGAVCLAMVGVVPPGSASIGRLPPLLVSMPALVERAVSRAVSPPHRPPKHV